MVVRAVTGLAVVAALGWFAYRNWDQAVDIGFGLFTLRDVSLSVALYAAVITGMLLMLAAGWRADTRRKIPRGGSESLSSGKTAADPGAESRVPQGADRPSG